MNISETIFEYLKQNPNAAIEGFGMFSLANSRAELDADSGVLLPPGKRISFVSDYAVIDSGFLNYIADRQAISSDIAQQELQSQVNFWRNKINAGEAFEIQPLGRFLANNEQIEFVGNRITADSPDFYGLEEINLADIRKKGVSGAQNQDYKANKSILYTFLVALPMLGILAAFIWKKDVIFGKKSFAETPVKTSTHRIVNDSVNVIKMPADSLKTDSIKKDSAKKVVPVVKKPYAAKRWHSKTYKKSKWTKRKKRATRSR